MQWYPVQSIEGVDELVARSAENPILIFKHSTRCGISSLALDRLIRQWNEEVMPSVKPVMVDVIANRSISDYIADRFNIIHESPQAIILSQGEVVYHTSHMGINFAAIESVIRPLLK